MACSQKKLPNQEGVTTPPPVAQKQTLAAMPFKFVYVSSNSLSNWQKFLKTQKEKLAAHEIKVKITVHSEKYNLDGSKVTFCGLQGSLFALFQDWQKLPCGDNDFLFFELANFITEFQEKSQNEFLKRQKQQLRDLRWQDQQEETALFMLPAKPLKINTTAGVNQRKIRWFHSSPKRLTIGTILVGNQPKSKEWFAKSLINNYITGVVYLTDSPLPHETLLYTLQTEKQNWHVYEVEPLDEVKEGNYHDGVTHRCRIIRYVGTTEGILNRLKLEKNKKKLHHGDLSTVRPRKIQLYKKRTKR